jgi:hypothetical protein
VPGADERSDGDEAAVWHGKAKLSLSQFIFTSTCRNCAVKIKTCQFNIENQQVI